MRLRQSKTQPAVCKAMRFEVNSGLLMPALLPCLLLLTVTGCNRGGVQPKPGPPSVTVAPVERTEIVEWEEFTGRIEPVESVEVRPRVSGYIQEVRFQSGQLVKKGDVLFVIDPRWHQAAFDQRQAEFEQAKVQNGQCQAGS